MGKKIERRVIRKERVETIKYYFNFNSNVHKAEMLLSRNRIARNCYSTLILINILSTCKTRGINNFLRSCENVREITKIYMRKQDLHLVLERY